MAISMFDELHQVLVGVQTELIVFLLAIATHLLFFHKWRPTPVTKGQKDRNQKGMPPISNLNAFKSALRAGDFQTAMARFEELHNLWQRQDASPSSAPGVLMQQLVKLALQKQALSQLLQVVSKLDLVESVLDTVLAECAEQGNMCGIKEAEDLARSQGLKMSAAAYQALLKCAGNSGTQADARRIVSKAQEDGVADVATYSTYMQALLKWGSTQEVRRVLDTMKREGLQPSNITFNKILSAAVACDAATLWSIVNEMKSFQVKPDQVTCSILLKSRCINYKAENVEKVIKLLDDADTETDEVLFNSVVDVCVRLGRADLLMPFLKQQRANKRITIKSAHTYGSIIRAYGYVQDIKGAWDIWNEMRRQHIAPISVTLGCMVEALVTNYDIEGGYELIHEMLSEEKTASLVNAVMYGSIVKGFSHNKNFTRMWEVYDEMVAQKLQFSMVTYNTLIDACARSGELNRIPSLLKDIDAQGLKMGLVTYSAILKGYCQKNLLDEAFELFDGMAKDTDLQPDEIMYNTLIDGCARQGFYDRGMKVFQKMCDAGVRPSNFTLSVLVKLANRSKKLEKAFEVCQEVSKKHGFRLNVHVLANLVQACIQHRDLPRAIDVLEQMLQDRVRPDVRTYSMILKACIEARQAKEADGILRTAMGLKCGHPQLSKFAATAAQPQGGLPNDLVCEILTSMMDTLHEERIAAALFVELKRLPGVKIDPKLRLRLASRLADL